MPFASILSRLVSQPLVLSLAALTVTQTHSPTSPSLADIGRADLQAPSSKHDPTRAAFHLLHHTCSYQDPYPRLQVQVWVPVSPMGL